LPICQRVSSASKPTISIAVSMAPLCGCGHGIGGPGGPPIRGPGPQGPPAGEAGVSRGQSVPPPSCWLALAAATNALYSSGVNSPSLSASAWSKTCARDCRLAASVRLSVPLPSTSRSARVCGYWLVDGAVGCVVHSCVVGSCGGAVVASWAKAIGMARAAPRAISPASGLREFFITFSRDGGSARHCVHDGHVVPLPHGAHLAGASIKTGAWLELRTRSP